MKKERVQRFSLRKLSIGLVSAAVGSIFLTFNTETVYANTSSASVTYNYVVEDELTEEERQLIIKELPKIENNKETYYLVYRPQHSGTKLPYTGSESLPNALIASAASLFIVIGIAVGKNKKTKITSVLLITTVGSALLSPSALAISGTKLSHFNQVVTVDSGNDLPTPLAIENYSYVGYIAFSNLSQQNKTPIDTKPIESTALPETTEAMTVQETTSRVETVKPEETTQQTETTKIVDSTELPETTETITVQETTSHVETVKPEETTRQTETTKIVDSTELPETTQQTETSETTTSKRTDIFEVAPPQKTPVKDIENLTDAEKEAVKQAVKLANPHLPSSASIIVDNSGKVTITYQDSSMDSILPSDTVEQQLEVIEEDLPFIVVYEADETLDFGRQQIIVEGVVGKKEITRNPINHGVVSEKVMAQPVNRIVKVGTKSTVTVEELPFSTIQTPDDTLEKGTEVVSIEGKNGKRTTTVTYTVDSGTGVVTANQSTVETVEPVDKVVRVGTKRREITVTESLPFVTVYEADDTLDYGQQIESQAGQTGTKEVVKEEETDLIKSETITAQPVNRIVKVGIKPSVTVEELPFNTTQTPDDTLERGTEVVSVEGNNGTKTTTVTYTVDSATGVVTVNQPTIETVEPVDKVVRVGTKEVKRIKPTLTIQQLEKNEDQKNVSVAYTLTDPDNAYVSAKAQLYKGNELIREIEISDVNQPLVISDLDYFTDYILKTNLTYNLGQGNQSEVQTSTQDFRLEYKKIEFKDITVVELYEKVGNLYQVQSNLYTLPVDLSQYFIKIKSAQSKEMLLPIDSIAETQKNGTAMYQVTVSLPELVQDSEGQYTKNAVFYIPKSQATGDSQANNYRANYLGVQNAVPEREVAYKNAEKLMPFYNKEYIVYLGNQIEPSNKLYQTELIDVVPMVDNQIITDVNTHKLAINRLMLHYADNTVEYVPLTFKEEFKNNRIAEYTIAGASVLYTPETFLNDYTNVISEVLPTLTAVQFDSSSMRQHLGIQDGDTTKSLNDLYLDKAFEMVQTNLSEELKKVLSTDAAINTPQGAVEDALVTKIKTNAIPFLLGLTYLNRWYNINYGDINVKDLSAYKLDFFGKQNVSTLDYIINLGNAGFNVLKAANNVSTFTNHIGISKNKNDLFDYLESYRQLFLPHKTNNDWLKENSKAYMVETLSAEAHARTKQDVAYGQKDNKYSVGIYDKIASQKWIHRNMLLPLLTLPEENVFLMSNIAGISFGGYERYTKPNLSDEEFKTYMHERVNQAAIWQRDYFDTWYRILNDASRDRLFGSMLTYDGFHYVNDNGSASWRTLHDKDSSIQNFFGPVGRYYKSNGSAAYATGAIIHYVVYKVLDRVGAHTFTHEMTHNLDGTTFFEGRGRREGLGAELFAQGLLEGPEKTGQMIGMNLMFQYEFDDINRYHASNPVDRYQTMEDLDQYVHRMFDVVYVLDYSEATATLKQNTEVKKKWLRKIENTYVVDKDGNETHAANRIRPLTDEEVEGLQNLGDLIDTNILNRRSYYDSATLQRNSYYTVSLLSPIYAALNNEKGAPGDLMFKRMAYELWAAKGYREGFLPYASNMYAKEAYNNGIRTWSSWFRRYVGLVTDNMVFDKILSHEYNSWEEFKKAMYQERINKLSQLKPITIQYEVGVPNSTKEITITSFEQLQTLMDVAMAQDIMNIDRTTSHAPASWVQLLKARVYNAYLRQTNDFKDSIFN